MIMMMIMSPGKKHVGFAALYVSQAAASVVRRFVGTELCGMWRVMLLISSMVILRADDEHFVSI